MFPVLVLVEITSMIVAGLNPENTVVYIVVFVIVGAVVQ